MRTFKLVSMSFAACLTWLFATADPLAAQAGGVVVAGRVIDSSTGLPVSGALVSLEDGSAAARLSDDDGLFELPGVVAGSATIIVTHVAYADWRGVATSGMRVGLTPRALPLDAVVITASRRLQRLAEAPVATEVISRREIEEAGATDLSQILTERLGVQLEGGIGSGEGIVIQGLGSQRVLVLLDGQPVVGRVNGMLDVSRLPASAVERIEVIKGPQSSLYGSDAIGGVVNVLTRGIEGPRLRGGVELFAGTEGRADGSVSIGGNRESMGFLSSFGRRSTNLTPGRSSTQGALAERWDGTLKIQWRPTATASVEASGMFVDDLQGWRSGTLYNFAEGQQVLARIGAQFDLGDHRLSPTIHFSDFDRLYRQSTSVEPVPGSGDHEVQRLIEAEVLYNGGVAGLAIDGGLEAKREYIESERIATRDRALHTVEPFLQATIGAGPVQVVPGGRLVWSEQWGTHLTPRVAAIYRPNESVALRASAGYGFRAPDFKELGMSFLNVGPGFGYEIRGNPDLKPEESRNVTVGLELIRPTLYLTVQGYHNDFDGFIETEVAGDSSGILIYRYGNVAAGFTRGAEVEVGWTYRGLRAEGGYAWLQAEDRDSGEALLGRAEHSGRLLVEHPLPFRSRATVTGTYTGETPVQRGETEDVYRPAFLRFDVRVATSLPAGVEASFGVNNLFDEVPESWPGFGRRHLYLGLSWNLPAGSY